MNLTTKIPSGIAPSPAVELFHDGMYLTWDQVTEIYEDEERRMHFVAFDSIEYSLDEMLQRMLELGFLDFGFHIILKSSFIFLHYVPGGIKTVEEQIVPAYRRCLREDGYPFNLMFPI
jgi:hypothetical protein